MMLHLIRAVYDYEPGVTPRALVLDLVVPVLSASLYLIVFGIVLGRELTTIEGIKYGAFIIPGLIIFSMATDAIANASSAIFSSKLSGAAFEILSHRISFTRFVFHYVGAPATAAALIGLFVLGVSRGFVDFTIVHPWYTALLFLTASVNFSICGFILGVWAGGWETLHLAIPLVVTPLVFFGGCFYSVRGLPSPWRTLALLNPMAFPVDGLRWALYGISDISSTVSLCFTLGFLPLCLVVAWWTVRSGYILK